MKDQFIASLYKDGQLVTTFAAKDTQKEALAMVETTEHDFDYAKVSKIHVKAEKGGA